MVLGDCVSEPVLDGALELFALELALPLTRRLAKLGDLEIPPGDAVESGRGEPVLEPPGSELFGVIFCIVESPILGGSENSSADRTGDEEESEDFGLLLITCCLNASVLVSELFLDVDAEILPAEFGL